MSAPPVGGGSGGAAAELPHSAGGHGAMEGQSNPASGTPQLYPASVSTHTTHRLSFATSEGPLPTSHYRLAGSPAPQPNSSMILGSLGVGGARRKNFEAGREAELETRRHHESAHSLSASDAPLATRNCRAHGLEASLALFQALLWAPRSFSRPNCSAVPPRREPPTPRCGHPTLTRPP